MKKYLLFTFLYLFIFSAESFCQFKIQDVSQYRQSLNSKNFEVNKIKKTLFIGATDLTKYLPIGFSKKGNVDYTDYLQRGINQNKKVILPNFPILINFKGLVLKSNSSILFQENSKLILKSNSEQLYGLLYVENIKNVNIYFAHLVGDRFSHQSDKGEWGMGVFIRSSENIKIHKPIITDMWGDGIYIGKLGSKSSKNITITGAFINKSRRNGISIISAENVDINNSFIANTHGTSPEFGIDIEPNSHDEILSNIYLNNNITFNNVGGLLFALDKLVSPNVINNKVDIHINDHTDNKSIKGVEFYMNRYKNNSSEKLTGVVNINNMIIKNSKQPVINNKGYRVQTNLNFKNLNIDGQNVTQNLIDGFKKSFNNGVHSNIKNIKN